MEREREEREREKRREEGMEVVSESLHSSAYYDMTPGLVAWETWEILLKMQNTKPAELKLCKWCPAG